MLVEFDFHVTQLRYIKAAVENIPTFSPDGMDAAAIDAVLTNADSVRQAYIDAKETFDLARGDYREAVNEGHDAAVGVYAAMKSRYRKDRSSLDAINGLPVQDQSADETIKRMEQTSSLWAKLPHIGTPAAEFVAWTGMARTDFDALKTAATTKQQDLPEKDQAFQVAEGNLHATDAEIADLVTAALQQGRAQFKSGTEREVIDAVPNEPAQQPPGQATISQATGGTGTVHLEFDAPHATSFDVFQKKAADVAFAKVADDIIEHSYGDGKLTIAGSYNFKVVGRNSLGEGPESTVSTVNVT
jgi:hypothetical protein